MVKIVSKIITWTVSKKLPFMVLEKQHYINDSSYIIDKKAYKSVYNVQAACMRHDRRYEEI